MAQLSAPIIRFLQSTFEATGKTKGLVAVSGGIDSASSLTLTAKALGTENTYALLLPYHLQSTEDARHIAEWNKLPADHILTENIGGAVDTLAAQLKLTPADKLRKGNLMARIRMVILYDWAKKLDALVVGTENKSEEILGYFTRFGDAASDIEPIQHLTKTQVRQLSQELEIPERFRTKAPSADLWQDQTDESELGFTYAQADAYIAAKEKKEKPPLTSELIKQIEARVASQKFKHEVPYTFRG